MIRAWSTVLGIGLVILGIAGFSSIGGTWIAWLDVIGGAITFIIAAAGSNNMAPAYSSIRRQVDRSGSGILSLSVALFAMWIIGLATGSVTTAMSWWNFAFGCAYGLLAVGAFSRRNVLHEASTTSTVERDRQESRRAG